MEKILQTLVFKLRIKSKTKRRIKNPTKQRYVTSVSLFIKILDWGVAKPLSWAVTIYCVGIGWAVTKYRVWVGWAVTKYQVGVGGL